MAEEITFPYKLPLPDDAWAVIRNPKKVPERLRRPVRLAANALQRTIPEDERKAAVVIAAQEAAEASEEVKAAFGAPPIAELETPDTELEPIPSDEQQAAVDAYNETLLLAVIIELSYGPANLDTLRDIPGDAYDDLLTEVRRLNKRDEDSEESLDSDPSAP